MKPGISSFDRSVKREEVICLKSLLLNATVLREEVSYSVEEVILSGMSIGKKEVKAVESLTSKLQRVGESPFPSLTGNASKNAAIAQQQMRGILGAKDGVSSWGRMQVNGRYEPVLQLRIPDGRGLAITLEGQFHTFLNPVIR
ncbi:hypothetical protein [Chitinimonas koreensis]|uniref:hypothetical protein n=1 Tax=Chitinimonas koreensis TaxID=356302 RepID=UPI001B7FD10E|nr:hypothetical protein [Chitinimonas koreensis]